MHTYNVCNNSIGWTYTAWQKDSGVWLTPDRMQQQVIVSRRDAFNLYTDVIRYFYC